MLHTHASWKAILPLLGLGVIGVWAWLFFSSVTAGQAVTHEQLLALSAREAVAAPSLLNLYSSPDIVISQVYASGGEHGATYKYDFIELFNRGTASVNLSGWTVQYAAGRNSTWQALALQGTLAPGQYYLVRLATDGIAGAELPDADVTGQLALQATAGRVALVHDAALLPFQADCLSDPQVQGKIVDFIGYGSPVLCAEGSAAAPAPGLTLALLRRNTGCQDTDQNGADFVTSAPQPRNSATPLRPCNGVTAPQANLVISTVTSSGPATQTSGGSTARLAQLFNRTDRPAIQTQTTGPSVVARGVLTVFITVRNTGPAAAANVLVSNTAPNGFTAVTANQNATISGLTAVWPVIPSLPSGASVSFTLTTTAPERPAEVSNVARVTSDTFDPDVGNNRSATPISVLAGARFRLEDMKLEFETPTSFCQSSFSATLTFTNTGYTTQANNADAELIVNLPRRVTPSSCFASQGSCRSNSGTPVIRWDGQVEVGQTVTVTLGVQVQVEPTTLFFPFCLELNLQYDGDNDGSNESVTKLRGCTSYECDNRDLPDALLSAVSEQSAQKLGSVLIYNLYSSDPTNPASQETRLSLTNANPDEAVNVHLFFVNGDSCEIADYYVCLTANQTFSVLASDIDPGVTGYLVAVATDDSLGCPINFNYLLGQSSVKLAGNHQAILSAESIAAIADEPVDCGELPNTVTLQFDGKRYNRLPRALALSSIASAAEGNVPLLVLNRIGGNLSSRALPLGKFFGLLYDDMEHAFSFSAEGGCQFRQLFSPQFPRTAPRYPQVIPSGHTGWLRLWAAEDYGLLGAVINYNPNIQGSATAFNGAQNLHKLTFTSTTTLTLPLFPPNCQ